MKYQVFVSYRRATGENLAQLLAYRLKEDGYSVFLDVESLRSGKFNTQLFSVIEECQDFLLVLSEKALDRCSDPKDWVRLEIEHALKSRKNIVPVLGRGFVFPSNLPFVDDIEYYQGVSANSEYFDASIDKIESFLVSVPKKTTIKTNGFFELLYNVYQNMITYREDVRKGDVQRINEESKNLQDSMQRIYLFYELNQFSNVENASKAKQIVNLYNLFVDYYGKFISFPMGESRMSVSAQQFAKKAEETFNSLVTMIVSFLSEQSNE